MLSLFELRRAGEVLAAQVSGARLQAVVQPDDRSIALTLYSGGPEGKGRHHVLLSCGAESARVSALSRPPQAPTKPPAFVQYLRAHAVGASVAGVRLLGDDRQLVLRLATRERELDLLLAIFGRRSNVVLLDAETRVLIALRRLADTRPELAVGDVWSAPGSRLRDAGEDRFAATPDSGYLEAIEAAYAAVERRDERDTLNRRVEQTLRKEARRLDGKLAKLARELERAEADAGLEQQGELLKGVLAEVSRGDTEVRARDHATGEEVTIALDPTRSPAENLEQIFKRYRRALRTMTKAGAQQQAVCEARDALESLQRDFAELDGDAQLEDFAARSEVEPILARYAPKPPPTRRAGRPAEKKRGKHVVPARLVPRRYRCSGDLEIWVGRSDAGNDHLTTRLARGKDLFFHLDGAPGSHVILRTEGRSDPPAEAILDACELAVHFSKFKNATRADVHVVPIKQVRKPKGAKPGLVMVHGGKTIHLRRMRGSLERVLAARIDD